MPFPPKPTVGQVVEAMLCEEFGFDPPPGVMTMKQWEQAVCLYWFERMIKLMEASNGQDNT